MTEIIAQRNFTLPYILLDTLFLLVLSILLLRHKKRLTFLFGLAGGVLYMLVDYGYFYLISGTRTIFVDEVLQGHGGTFWVLLWMSMSYGFTNFAWIWLCLGKDSHISECTILIFGWWVACPMIAELFPGATAIQTVRLTGPYHGFMAVILIVSYLGVIMYNLRTEEHELKWNITRLFVIGVLIQFGWEFGLLLGGVRSAGMTFPEQLRTLAVNSLVETNLGLPGIYLIYLALSTRYTEDLQKRRITLKEAIRLNNLANS